MEKNTHMKGKYAIWGEKPKIKFIDEPEIKNGIQYQDITDEFVDGNIIDAIELFTQLHIDGYTDLDFDGYNASISVFKKLNDKS
jgi:hypothetical protein